MFFQIFQDEDCEARGENRPESLLLRDSESRPVIRPETAEAVKREAKALLEHFSEDELKDLCARYAAEGISPGGAADMLALTLFIDTITS